MKFHGQRGFCVVSRGLAKGGRTHASFAERVQTFTDRRGVIKILLYKARQTLSRREKGSGRVGRWLAAGGAPQSMQVT